MTASKNCKHCGKKFPLQTPGQLYCSPECKVEATSHWENKSNQLWREKHKAEGYCSNCCCRKPTPGKKTCSICQARARKVHARLKNLMLEHYGKVCACCGESDPRFLTIDHIEGRSIEELKGKSSGYHLYSRLKREGFPGGFQTLCFNCNHGRWINGGICPHKDPL